MEPPAPALTGLTPAGEAVAVDTDGPAAVLVVFLTSSCTGCRPVWNRLARAARRRGGPRVVAVTPSPSTESAREVAALAPPGVTVIMASEVWHAFSVTGAPWYVLTSGGRVLASGRPGRLMGLSPWRAVSRRLRGSGRGVR